MKNVLFLNHKQWICGVHQFGRRVYDLASESKNINYVYKEIDSYAEYKSLLSWFTPEYILYNWHRGTMPWLTEEMVAGNKKSKHYFIFHEEFMRKNYDKYLFFGDYDMENRVPENRRTLLPRPLLRYSGSYQKNSLPTIGSFGFALKQKGLPELVKKVNEEFDNAVINFQIPKSFFGDPLGTQAKEVIIECKRANVKPGIKLTITQDFLNDTKTLEFLAKNDINVFLYGENGEGISSVIDYSLSVKRPIGITDCGMFRHIKRKEILIPENSIKEIISLGTLPLEPLYKKWNPDNFSKEMEKAFND